MWEFRVFRCNCRSLSYCEEAWNRLLRKKNHTVFFPTPTWTGGMLLNLLNPRHELDWEARKSCKVPVLVKAWQKETTLFYSENVKGKKTRQMKWFRVKVLSGNEWDSSPTEEFKLLTSGNLISVKHGDKDRKKENSPPSKMLLHQ